VESVKDQSGPFAQASTDHRFAVAVAQFAQVLRKTPAVGKTTLESSRSIAAGALGSDPSNTRRELIALIDSARRLSAH
jgi:Ca-activated chloride channel family protein